VHDYFHILGVSDRAPAEEIRRALGRRRSRSHPDFEPGPDRTAPFDPGHEDAALDFVDMRAVVDRIQAAFFGVDAGRPPRSG